MFCGPLSAIGNISFYIPDENWLNQALQVKKDRDTYILSNLATVELSDNAKSYMTILSKLANDIDDLINNHNCPDFYNVLDSYFKKVKSNDISITTSNRLKKSKTYKASNIDNPNDIYSLSLVNVTEYTIKKHGYSITDFLLKIKQALMNKFNDATYFKDLSIDEEVTYSANTNIETVKWIFNIHLNRESITDED